MKKDKFGKMLSYTLMIVLLIGVAFLFGTVHQLKNEVNRLVIMSDDEVGIAHINDETIVSAKFDSHIPTYAYEVTDYKLVGVVLSSLDNAVFQKCEKPTKTDWMELLCIKTDQSEYVIGVENGIFRITIDGTTNYYHCSKKSDFVETLCEVQGR